MDLREKIASLFAVARRSGADDKPGKPEDFADLVLAIPEIKEALSCREGFQAEGLLDKPNA
jgi:hypothetical protein